MDPVNWFHIRMQIPPLLNVSLNRMITVLDPCVHGGVVTCIRYDRVMYCVHVESYNDGSQWVQDTLPLCGNTTWSHWWHNNDGIMFLVISQQVQTSLTTVMNELYMDSKRNVCTLWTQVIWNRRTERLFIAATKFYHQFVLLVYCCYGQHIASLCQHYRSRQNTSTTTCHFFML